MGSMYRMVFGKNPHGERILALLGLIPEDVGRFRDAFVSEGKIAVYTRNGGGNRPDYQGVFEKLAKHPCYLKDEDDDFDCTYATIWFKFPDGAEAELRSFDTGESFDPDKRWAEGFTKLKAGDKDMLERMKPLADLLNEALTGGKSVSFLTIPESKK